MTAGRNRGAPKPFCIGDLTLEIKKSKRKCTLTVNGVMGISALSENAISLASHSGRVEIVGEGLSLSVFENGALEISGDVSDVRLGYVKA